MAILSGLKAARWLGAASVAFGLAWISPASAQSCPAGYTSVPLSYTGNDQTVVVPAGVTSAFVYISGAQGGNGIGTSYGGGGVGGSGARVSGSMTVSPGETLTVGVGGQGSLAVNPGGAGGTDINTPDAHAGHGGGGTDIRRGVTRIAIAAGGGGGGNSGFGNGSGTASGGAGGASGGGAGNTGATLTGLSDPGPFGGGGGSGTTGGAAGLGCPSFPATAGSASGAGGGTWQFSNSPVDGAGAGGGGGGGATTGAGGGGAGVGTTTCVWDYTGGGGGGAGGLSSAGTLTGAILADGVKTGDGAALICFAPVPYTISGTGSSTVGPVTLDLTTSSGNQTIAVPANAAGFAFPGTYTAGTTWSIAVAAKPSNQTCSITPSSGTFSADVNNLVLSCTTTQAQNLNLAVMQGTTGTVSLQTGATGGPFTAATIVTPAAAAAGTASIIQVGGVYTLQFAAAPTYSGVTALTYTLSNASSTSTPATVTITVTARPDPSLDAEVVGLVRGEAETARRFAATQIRSFNERLEQLHDEGVRRTNSARLSVSGGDVTCAAFNDDEPGGLTRRPDLACAEAGRAAVAYADPRNAAGYANGATGAGSSAVPAAATSAAGEGGHTSPYALWLGGYVDFGSADNGLADLTNTLVGVSGGVDYRFSSSFTAGLGLGYGHDKTAFGAGSRTLAEAYAIAIYASYRPSPGLYVDGLVGYSGLTYDSDRHVTATSDTARGERDGDQIFGSISLGYEYRSARGLLFAPYGRLSGSSTTLDAFTETGAGIWNLTYAEQTVDQLSGTLGMRLENDFALDNGSLTGRFRFEYTHDFEGSSIANLGYADIGLLLYEIDAPAFSKNYLTFGLGFDARFNSGTLIGLTYNGSVGLNGDSVQHLVAVKFAVPF